MGPQPIVIQAFDDPRVDAYRDVRDADLRGRDGLFMAESELVIRRLLRTPARLHSLLLSPEKFARLQSALCDLPASASVYVAELKLMHEIAAFHVHRGALAAGYRLPPEQLTIDAALRHLRLDADRHLLAEHSPAEHPPAEPGAKGGASRRDRVVTLLLAEGITNVDNMGGLFRNAAAFGVDGVVLDPTCCDPLYRKAIRVSMGHVLSIPYAVSHDWPRDLDRLKLEWGITLIGAESTESARPLWKMPRQARTGIVFGSEGHGLSPGTLARCDMVCTIPMAKDVPSINVALASAVFLYELARGAKGDGATKTC